MTTVGEFLAQRGAEPRDPRALTIESGIAAAALMIDGQKVAGLSRFTPFNEWLVAARPNMSWDSAHFLLIDEVLDSITLGDIDRLILEVAIRHGKTETGIGYNAYRIEQNPATRILVPTYNQRQARKLSRAIRRLYKRRGGKVVSDSDDEWETSEGGGVRAVGAGAGVASVNADLIWIDDPIGSRDEAESPAHRDRVWDWLTSDILARAEPHTQVVISMPRWHIDDPIGRLLDRQKGRWYVIDLPGVAEEAREGEPPDALGRAPGELLWPELRGQAWMDDMRVDLGTYGFASLMQCRPRPREGGMFKWDWWKLLDIVPAIGPMVRYWDLAGTEARRGADPDYSAGALACRPPDGRTVFVDVERFRHSVARRDARLEEICKADLKAFGGRISWWIETEAGIAGKERTAELVRRLQNLGMPVYTERATGSKRSRAEPLASKAEAGNVWLCPGVWRDPFRQEASDFTGDGGSHDDQIDAAAGADAKLAVPTPAVTIMRASI